MNKKEKKRQYWRLKRKPLETNSRSFKNYRNARIELDKFFKRLSFEDKIKIIKQIKPELFQKLVSTYAEYRKNHDLKNKKSKILEFHGQDNIERGLRF